MIGIILLAAGIIICIAGEVIMGVPLAIVGIGLMLIPSTPAKKQQKQQPSSAGKSTPATRKGTPAKKKTVPAKTVPAGAPAVDAYAFQGTADDYFEALLRGCFPAYTLRRNAAVGAPAVSAAAAWECGCGAVNTGKFCAECGKAKPVTKDWTCSCGARNTGKFCAECGSIRPVAVAADSAAPKVSFMLYRGSVPACAIVLTPKNQWNTDEINAIVEACAKAGIPCLKFYEEFRNEADYVINRINQVLC